MKQRTSQEGMTAPAQAIPANSRQQSVLLSVLTNLTAGLCLLPLVAVLIAAFSGGWDVVAHLAETVLFEYTVTTLLLCALVFIGTICIGTITAWLITTTRFPLHGFFEAALVIPLAFPSYILAYAYTHLLDHPGPVQSGLRALMGWGPRDYWFPEVRSTGGAALMLTLVLYPYIYLLCRSTFLQQGAGPFIVARTLGQSPLSAFLRVSLPMARPAILGGALIVVMETIADYGTVAHFGVQTFATGIYTSWFSMADRAAAAQLSLGLLSFALLVAVLEHQSRGRAKFYTPGMRRQPFTLRVLTGWRRFAAMIICAIPVLFGAVIPMLTLFAMGLNSEQSLMDARYLSLMRNSLLLASLAALLTVAGAIALGYGRRLRPGRIAAGKLFIGRLGYAVPGGVIAVGLLVPFAMLDNQIDAWAREALGVSTGLLFTGSVWLLVCAYVIRFLAVALEAYESGQAALHPHMDAVSRTLGMTAFDTLRRVHLPILRPSILSGLLIVFVEVMKELPATLIMRPFNFDTLAVQAYRLASDERLDSAAVPSLVIAVIGLLPVLLLRRQMRKARGRPEPATPNLPDERSSGPQAHSSPPRKG